MTERERERGHIYIYIRIHAPTSQSGIRKGVRELGMGEAEGGSQLSSSVFVKREVFAEDDFDVKEWVAEVRRHVRFCFCSNRVPQHARVVVYIYIYVCVCVPRALQSEGVNFLLVILCTR